MLALPISISTSSMFLSQFNLLGDPIKVGEYFLHHCHFHHLYEIDTIFILHVLPMSLLFLHHHHLLHPFTTPSILIISVLPYLHNRLCHYHCSNSYYIFIFMAPLLMYSPALSHIKRQVSFLFYFLSPLHRKPKSKTCQYCHSFLIGQLDNAEMTVSEKKWHYSPNT